MFSSSSHFVCYSVRSYLNYSKKCSKVAILFFDYKMKFRHEYPVQKLGNNFCSQKEALLGGWMDEKSGP